MDKRMYREQLSDYLYEQAKSDWESKPAGKRGTPPTKPHHPKYTDTIVEKEQRSKDDIPPDIDNFGDFRVEWIE